MLPYADLVDPAFSDGDNRGLDLASGARDIDNQFFAFNHERARHHGSVGGNDNLHAVLPGNGANRIDDE